MTTTMTTPPVERIVRRVSPAILLAALVAACSGGGGSTGPTTPSSPATATDSGPTSSEQPAEDPATHLVALVDEIVAKVQAAGDCDQLATALAVWTNRNKQIVEQLIAELQAAPSANPNAGELNQQVVDGYLVVVEAAADCGDNDAAMRAYDSFNEAVQQATY